MILNIRGTSGSGKSTLVRQLMEHGTTEPRREGTRILGYQAVFPQGRADALVVGVVGKYETPCGGCDAIKTQDEICDRVRAFARWADHVVFEGLLVSQIYGRYRDLAREFIDAGTPFTMACLDTPLDLCLERVTARRRAAGNDTPLNPANTTQKWHDCQRNYVKATGDGLRPVWLDHRDPLADVRALLGV